MLYSIHLTCLHSIIICTGKQILCMASIVNKTKHYHYYINLKKSFGRKITQQMNK